MHTIHSCRIFLSKSRKTYNYLRHAGIIKSLLLFTQISNLYLVSITETPYLRNTLRQKETSTSVPHLSTEARAISNPVISLYPSYIKWLYSLEEVIYTPLPPAIQGQFL